MCRQEKLSQSSGCHGALPGGAWRLGRVPWKVLAAVPNRGSLGEGGAALGTPAPLCRTPRACSVGARWMLRATGGQDALPSASGARRAGSAWAHTMVA